MVAFQPTMHSIPRYTHNSDIPGNELTLKRQRWDYKFEDGQRKRDTLRSCCENDRDIIVYSSLWSFKVFTMF